MPKYIVDVEVLDNEEKENILKINAINSSNDIEQEQKEKPKQK